MRLLGTLQLGALEVKVQCASVAEQPSLSAEWGYYDPEHKIIYLPETMQPDRFEVILIHEILHACLDVTQMATKLQNVAKKRYADSIEEDVVSALSNVLTQALHSAKKLKKPRKKV